MDRKVIHWGVLGCANIADGSVIPGIKEADNARLYAIAGRDAGRLEQFREKHRPVTTYGSYEALLEDPEVDAVYIPLPNGLHCEWVVKAAEHKKHILCEKPLGVSPEEVKIMDEACRKNGVLLMEAFAYRHSPLTLKVKEMIAQGLIGRIKYIESHFSFILTDLANVRLVKSLGGGATYDVGCYNINIIRYIAGAEPVSVYAAGDIGPKSGVDESSCIMMQFGGDLKAVSFCSFNSASACGYRIIGDEGVIDVPANFNQKGIVGISLKKDGGVKQISIECPDNYMLEIEQFGRCILEGEQPLVSISESFGNAEVIDRALAMIYKK